MLLSVVPIFGWFSTGMFLGCKYHPVCEKGTCSPTQTVFSYKLIHLPRLTWGRLVTKETELCMVLHASPTCRPTTPPRATVTGTCKKPEAFNRLPLCLYLGFRSQQMHRFVFSPGRMLSHGQEDIFRNYPELANQHSSLETEWHGGQLRGQETLPGMLVALLMGPYGPPCDSVSPRYHGS